MAAGTTLLMRLLGRGGGGHSARRKERAKALLKHLYYNRRLIRLVLVALIWLVGLYVTWKVSSSSSSSAAGGGEEGLPVVSLVAKQRAGTWESKLGEQEEVRRKAGVVSSAAASPPSAKEEEIDEDDEMAGWNGEDDDDDEGMGEQQEEEQEHEEAKANAGAAAPPQAAALELDPAVERRRDHCMVEYGQRRYLEEEDYTVPPVLYSYPGSGNTWVRLLIDYATGVYTGSILDDETLMEPLPGQGHCDRSVSAIKAHPNHFEPRRLFNMEQDKQLEEEYERYRRRAAMHKERAAVERGDEMEEEETEEDWDAAEGEGHEAYAEEEEEEDDWNKIRAGPMSLLRQECLHKGGIRGFKRFILLFRNPYDAIWSEYQRKFMTSHNAPITRADFDKEHFAQWAPRYAFKYVMMLNDFHVVERHSKRKDIFILKYEHLKKKRKRMATLRKLVNFLHLDAPDPARLACADVLADRPDTHRIKAPNAITKEEVYSPEVACMMWLIFGGRTEKLGYGLPPWVSKEECAAVKYDWSKLMLPRRLRVKQKQAALAMEVGKEAEKGKGKDEGKPAARKEGSAKGQVEKR